jgi:hypothetical protein
VRLAALDARFDVAALEIQPNVAAVAFRPRSRILFIINKLFNCEA